MTNAKNEYFGTDQYYRDVDSRRSFMRQITALTGMTVVTGGTLMRGAPTAIAGDAANSDKAWGGIKGRVKLKNADIPERKEVDLSKTALNPADLKWFKSMGPILGEDWVVNKENKGIQWVCVWLIPDDKRARKPLEAHGSLIEKIEKDPVLVVDQEPTGYGPHMAAVMEGQSLDMRNTGPVAHVFNWQPFKNKPMNVAMPPKSNVLVENLKEEPVAVQINCPPHPWERMHLRVFDHPYFAITNENGEFEFNMVPSGPVRMVIWQESIGYLGGRTGKYGQQIEIEGAAITDLGDIELEATT